jgi:hypothetical protein
MIFYFPVIYTLTQITCFLFLSMIHERVKGYMVFCIHVFRKKVLSVLRDLKMFNLLSVKYKNQPGQPIQVL